MSAQIVQVKQQLISEIEALPEHRLPEVLNFVHFLQQQEQTEQPPTATNPDPLQAFIGGVSHGTLAQNLDEELYG